MFTFNKLRTIFIRYRYRKDTHEIINKLGLSTVPNYEITLQTDFVLDDEAPNSYVTELIDVIRELNIQVQTKDEQLESIQEELRSRSIWNKGELHVSRLISKLQTGLVKKISESVLKSRQTKKAANIFWHLWHRILVLSFKDYFQL